jgi:negative regulator of sigma E activity
MFRSVKESRRLPEKHRWLYRVEGLAMAAVVSALVIFGFAWLLSAPGP